MKIKEVEKLEVLVASVKLNDVHKIGEKYASTILKDAKLKDLNLSPSEEKYIKDFISEDYNHSLWYWDGNLEFNYDMYYEEGDEDRKFESPRNRRKPLWNGMVE